MKRGWIFLGAVLAFAAIGFGGWSYISAGPKESGMEGLAFTPDGLPVYEDSAYNVRAPAETRIVVEVLNATTRRGLARRATQYLRDRGFDVVLVGNSTLKVDTTLVYDRINKPEFAALVAAAMKGRMELNQDSSRYVDVTVLVGDNWDAPALPLNP